LGAWLRGSASEALSSVFVMTTTTTTTTMTMTMMMMIPACLD
jgi:hypothetical protein